MMVYYSVRLLELGATDAGLKRGLSHPSGRLEPHDQGATGVGLSCGLFPCCVDSHLLSVSSRGLVRVCVLTSSYCKVISHIG